MQIAAMHHRIRVAEPRAKRFAQIDMGDLFGRERIHQPELVDIDGHAARGLADAEIVEGMKGVGPELDAGADFAERGGLFQQDRADALLRKAERGGEAADAAARDQHGLCAAPIPSARLPEMFERVFGAQRHPRGLVVEIDQLRQQRQQRLAVGRLQRLQHPRLRALDRRHDLAQQRRARLGQIKQL